MKTTYYIDYLNKAQNFRTTRKHFTSYQEAKNWMTKNIGNANPDMINEN